MSAEAEPGTRTDDDGVAVPEEVLRARAYLMRLAEPPAPRLAHLVALLGPVEAAERIRGGADLGRHVGAEVNARRDVDRVDADLDGVRALGGRLVVPEDADWPVAAMAGFDHPGLDASTDWVTPLGLWVRGPGSLATVGDAGHRSVAVVGSRAATGYGRWVAREWSASLADEGLTVVSGAAFGIDGAAHRGALAVDGRTVAVLACGVERAYPAAHARLLETIAAQGLVVSEYPVGAVPARHRFLVRNRLIAALASGTLVVEAGARSGATRTASAALELGRPVMAVPGPVTSALSVGSHHLARQPGVTLVGSVDDVLADVGPVRDSDTSPVRPSGPLDGLSTPAVRVHGALRGFATATVIALARESGVDPSTVPAALDELAAAGLVILDGERGWCRSG
ncbi:DNA-processing protein DprA [Actinomycetospora endophytica]|uniref:DNA-processing protein DprA n=1 Tax=Actinomycetospora endophytica TaxID=2291215 RepID=A0ABS8PFT4_9PSEU|nr:DNA-processing protein DprA [Actinomycetospora endophytica]MCD2197127.1 DNA-processing protein DprA [Actinomycetospora endophytica]